MEVEIRERLQASTHTVFICRVVRRGGQRPHPMVYSAGRFFDGGALPPWDDDRRTTRRTPMSSATGTGNGLIQARVIAEMRRRIISGELSPG